jgi:hypothetical protein
MNFQVQMSKLPEAAWDSDATGLKITPYRTWVGFKDSFDCIEKYEILANGISKYTQSYPIEESFLTNCSATDTIKKADLYSKARHKDVWKNKFGHKCGQVLEWKPGQPIQDVNLKLKIDIRRFLILSNIRYLPAFAGKIELKLMFGTSGLVVSNLDPKLIFDGNLDTHDAYIESVTPNFVQIGQYLCMPYKAETKELTGENKHVTRL